MGDLVNLRAARKRAKRRQAEQQAYSRLVHGRSKAQRAIERSRSDKADKALDRHRIETGDGQ